MSTITYRGDRAREFFNLFVELIQKMTQDGEFDLMDVGGLDYSECRHDQPDNILRVAYSVQFPGEEDEREGIMFLEHKSAIVQEPRPEVEAQVLALMPQQQPVRPLPRRQQSKFQICHVLINRDGNNFVFQ